MSPKKELQNKVDYFNCQSKKKMLKFIILLMSFKLTAKKQKSNDLYRLITLLIRSCRTDFLFQGVRQGSWDITAWSLLTRGYSTA